MFTKIFWLAATERAAKTAAQAALLAIIGSAALTDSAVNAFEIDWPVVGGFFLGGAVISYLTSVISAPFGTKGMPTLLPVKDLPPQDGE